MFICYTFYFDVFIAVDFNDSFCSFITKDDDKPFYYNLNYYVYFIALILGSIKIEQPVPITPIICSIIPSANCNLSLRLSSYFINITVNTVAIIIKMSNYKLDSKFNFLSYDCCLSVVNIYKLNKLLFFNLTICNPNIVPIQANLSYNINPEIIANNNLRPKANPTIALNNTNSNNIVNPSDIIKRKDSIAIKEFEILKLDKNNL